MTLKYIGVKFISNTNDMSCLNGPESISSVTWTKELSETRTDQNRRDIFCLRVFIQSNRHTIAACLR